jgi:hypothetical protein
MIDRRPKYFSSRSIKSIDQPPAKVLSSAAEVWISIKRQQKYFSSRSINSIDRPPAN